MRRFMMKRSWLALLLVGLVALTSACGSSVEQDDTRPEDEKNAEPAPLNDKVFVSADELVQFAEDGATIIDARAPEDYAAGHYPGAVNTHGGKAWKDDHGILITDVVKAQQQVRDLGVDRDRPVVLYGAPRSSRTGRLFWTLEYYGHGQVYFYPDGYPNLKAAIDFEEQTDTPDVTEGDFVIAERDSVKASADDVQKAIDGDLDAILVDTRRETEYQGTEDRGDPRQGYIPHAIWYYFENVYDDTDHLRSKEDLRQEFEDLGLIEDGALVIPYCQTGTRSATIYAVERWLGYETKNYDGSWVEWSRGDYPIEQPQNDQPTSGSGSTGN